MACIPVGSEYEYPDLEVKLDITDLQIHLKNQ